MKRELWVVENIASDGTIIGVVGNAWDLRGYAESHRRSLASDDPWGTYIVTRYVPEGSDGKASAE